MKIVVISGATKGLGLAIAERVVRDGYRVIAVARKASPGLSALIAGAPEQIALEPYDFVDAAGIHAFVTRLVKTHGRPWGLVNNAAIGQEGILATLHEKDIGTLLRVNLESPILFTKYLLRPMLLSREGRIVNITSITASTGFKGLAVYGATKAGLASFSKSLAREVGPAGITVNNVAPGYMETDMTAELGGEKLEAIRRRSALGRLVEPGDVAHAVSYLLSEQAASITGTTVTVDAGSTA